jgi:quercetin dioxygenase-like cupin family protein
MRFLAILFAVITTCLAFSSHSDAQTTKQGPIRTVLALGRVQSLIETPMHFKLSRVSIPTGESVIYNGDPSAIYLLFGSLRVTSNNDARILQRAEGTFLPSQTDITLQAHADGAVEILQYQLVPLASLEKKAMGEPASVIELHRMRIPDSSIKSGPHEFSMIRVTLPAGASRPRPHTRSGAALYYVLSGGDITVWPSATVEALTGQSRTESRPVGSVQEEPFGFIHSWTPKADSELVLLQANVSREGAPEIIFVK